MAQVISITRYHRRHRLGVCVSERMSESVGGKQQKSERNHSENGQKPGKRLGSQKQRTGFRVKQCGQQHKMRCEDLAAHRNQSPKIYVSGALQEQFRLSKKTGSQTRNTEKIKGGHMQYQSS